MKTLKISDELHENLKSYASNTGLVLQDLVEKKLDELVGTTDAKFQADDVQYFNKNKLFSLLLTPKDFQTLISLLKKLCLNERITNIDQMNSILDSITMMQLAYNEHAQKESSIASLIGEYKDNIDFQEDEEEANDSNDEQSIESFFSSENSHLKSLIDTIKKMDTDSLYKVNDELNNKKEFFDKLDETKNSKLDYTELSNMIKEVQDNENKFLSKILSDENIKNFEEERQEKEEYASQKFIKVKVSKSFRNKMIQTANDNGVKNKGGVLERSIYFNLYLYRNVKNITEEPIDKQGVIEVIGFSKIDGHMIFRSFTSTFGPSETVSDLLKHNSGKVINPETNTISLPNIKKDDISILHSAHTNKIDYKSLPNTDLFKTHIDRAIFNKHYLCDTVLTDKDGNQTSIENVKIDVIELSNGDVIDMDDLMLYDSDSIDEEVIQKHIIESLGGTKFKINYKDIKYTNDETEIKKLDDFINDLIKEKSRKRNIKINDTVYFLQKSLVDNHYYFAGNIHDLNVKLSTNISADVSNIYKFSLKDRG
jgi:hypothetical protein